MSIRLPLTTVLDYNQTVENGAGVAGTNASTAGGVAKAFLIPEDTDNVVVKIQASIKGGGMDVVFQTSDDGGTTYYDVARSSTVSNANATTAEWLSIPVVAVGVKPLSVDTVYGSIAGRTVGRAGASTLSQMAYSGMPILGQQNRIFLQYTAGITSIISERVKVMVNHQSATA